MAIRVGPPTLAPVEVDADLDVDLKTRAPDRVETARRDFEPGAAAPRRSFTARVRPEDYVQGTHVQVYVGGRPQEGVLIGREQTGDAIVELARTRDLVSVPFEEMAGADGSVHVADARTHAFAGIREEDFHGAPPALTAAMDKALDQEVLPGHTLRDYVQALEQRGHTVFIVGGAIRDALRLLYESPNASPEKVLEALRDIDLVTSASPEEIWNLAHEIGREVPDAGVWTQRSDLKWGTVGVGQHANGLDITSIRADAGSLADVVFGKRLNDDAGMRDFAGNALYFDLKGNQIIDPSGKGYAAAQNNMLHLMPSFDQRVDGPWRYLKFRARGLGADTETKARIADAVRRTWQDLVLADAKPLVSTALRTLPGEAREGTPEQMTERIDPVLAGYRAVADADGFGTDFNTYAPNTRDLVGEILRRRALNAPRR